MYDYNLMHPKMTRSIVVYTSCFMAFGLGLVLESFHLFLGYGIAIGFLIVLSGAAINLLALAYVLARGSHSSP